MLLRYVSVVFIQVVQVVKQLMGEESDARRTGAIS
jgi:hypothetical protein